MYLARQVSRRSVTGIPLKAGPATETGVADGYVGRLRPTLDAPWAGETASPRWRRRGAAAADECVVATHVPSST